MAGTVVLSSQRAEGVIRWARILATGDAADGSFPTATLRSLGVFIDGTIIGIETNPGGTAPTNNYDLVLNDGDGLDRLEGAGADRSATNTEWAVVGRACGPDETLTLTLTNNSVNGATIEIVIFWTPAAPGAAGSSSSAITSLTPGTAAGNLGKAEDAAHSSGDTGVFALTVRKDTAASTAGTDGDYAAFVTDSSGAMYVNPGVLTAGSDYVSLGAAVAGGCSVYKSLDLDESEEEVKATAGTFYGFYFVNRTTSVRYFKLYDNTAAGTTVGTTAPTATFELPANASDHVAGNVLTPAMGIACATGITVAVTTGFADNDSGAPGANDVIVAVYYK